ncbi:uncharacterized protein LOC133200559 [Saccostrea echinata]|uniref:uncharacterized protein LOC133200559 n=1 Tax=Saccostrea echinata TaxID=191078 RepID=UPI002A7F94FD|nr:uncharacterized protein LOC133200559 [Saccostrea echinata]
MAVKEQLLEKFEKHYEELTADISEQGEKWHQEIDNIVNKMKSEIKDMKNKHLSLLDKQEEEISQNISVIKQYIVVLKKMVAYNDIHFDNVFAYKSKNAEFPLFITTIENNCTSNESKPQSTPRKPLLDEPKIINTIATPFDKQYNVACLSDEDIWTCGYDNKIKLYNLKGKLITENRNLDICVCDSLAKAVVVVNEAGKLRFRYTFHPLIAKKSFNPCGITTDSQSQILTSDFNNNCIHILDQDGQFLRYIDNCDLQDPWGLCMDSKDNLFVAEYGGRVKKIKYM